MKAHNSKFSVFLLTVMIGLLWMTLPVQAEVVFTYTDDSGKVHYSDFMSSIPLEYRSKAKAKYLPGKKTKSTTQGSTDDSQGSGSTSASNDSTSGKDAKEVGLSKGDETLLKEAQNVLGQMVSMSERFSGVMMNATNGRNMVNEIQSKLSVKEALVKKISGSKDPTLGSIKGFLSSSIAIDQKTTSIGSGLKTYITSIRNRIDGDAF